MAGARFPVGRPVGRQPRPIARRVYNEEDDDDEPFASKKWVPRRHRTANHESVGRDGFDVATAPREVLEREATERSAALTDATRNLLRIVEGTNDVADGTLAALADQGEKLERIHEKTVTIDQEMDKAETLVAKLGGFSKCWWRLSKGRRIAAGTCAPSASTIQCGTASNATATINGTEGRLQMSCGTEKVDKPSRLHGMDALDVVKADQEEQDMVLDAVSEQLATLRDKAMHIGGEVNRQCEVMDQVIPNVSIVIDNSKTVNKRLGHLLRK